MASGVKLPFNVQEASRKLRQELVEQKQNAQRNKEVLCDISTNRLDEAVKRLDQVRERGEALGDGAQKSKDVSAQAEILRTLAGYGVVAANKLVQQQEGRGPMELVKALRAAFVHTSDPQLDGEEDPMAFCWAELAARTQHLRKPARGAHCILGALDARPKERKAPQQRAKRQELAQLERPAELEKIEEKDKQETDRNMEVMWEIITKLPKPEVAMCELVCNHASFAQTVENIFTLLFLIKDNRVVLFHDTVLGLCVRALVGSNRAADNAAGAAGGKNQAGLRQFIISFNMADWEIMKEIVEPSQCLMPHRERLHAAGGGQAGKRRSDAGAGPSNNKKRRMAP